MLSSNLFDDLASSDQIPIFDAKEVGEQLNLDETTIDRLTEHPLTDKNLILIINFRENFVKNENFESTKQAILTALKNFGGKQISDNAFQFESWHGMHHARDQIANDMSHVFYSTIPAVVRSLNISDQPTITTTAVHAFPDEGGKMIINPFEFFRF